MSIHADDDRQNAKLAPRFAARPDHRLKRCSRLTIMRFPRPGLPGYSYLGDVAKQAGATNIATLAIQGIPSSVIDNQTAAKAFEQAGVKVGYVEDSLPLGTVDVGPIVERAGRELIRGPEELERDTACLSPGMHPHQANPG